MCKNDLNCRVEKLKQSCKANASATAYSFLFSSVFFVPTTSSSRRFFDASKFGLPCPIAYAHPSKPPAPIAMTTAVSPETASSASHFFVELVAELVIVRDRSFLCSAPIRCIRAAKAPAPILIQCMMKFTGACIQRRRVCASRSEVSRSLTVADADESSVRVSDTICARRLFSTRRERGTIRRRFLNSSFVLSLLSTVFAESSCLLCSQNCVLGCDVERCHRRSTTIFSAPTHLLEPAPSVFFGCRPFLALPLRSIPPSRPFDSFFPFAPTPLALTTEAFFISTTKVLP